MKNYSKSGTVIGNNNNIHLWPIVQDKVVKCRSILDFTVGGGADRKSNAC